MSVLDRKPIAEPLARVIKREQQHATGMAESCDDVYAAMVAAVAAAPKGKVKETIQDVWTKLERETEPTRATYQRYNRAGWLRHTLRGFRKLPASLAFACEKLVAFDGEHGSYAWANEQAEPALRAFLDKPEGEQTLKAARAAAKAVKPPASRAARAGGNGKPATLDAPAVAVESAAPAKVAEYLAALSAEVWGQVCEALAPRIPHTALAQLVRAFGEDCEQAGVVKPIRHAEWAELIVSVLRVDHFRFDFSGAQAFRVWAQENGIAMMGKPAAAAPAAKAPTDAIPAAVSAAA